LVLAGVSPRPASSQAWTPDPASTVPPPTSGFASDEADPAGRIARRIAQLVPTFPNLRAAARHGRWLLDERARWAVRDEAACLQELASLGIDAAPFPMPRSLVPTPVVVRGPIGGVRYEMLSQVEFIVSCELAARLPSFSEVMREHGLDRVVVSSTWRSSPRTSFHRMALALDIRSFYGPGSRLVVAGGYVTERSRATCPASSSAPRLQRIACDLADTGRFSTVITPSYSPGHWNHFHVDARPDDPRIFVR
jgi:hypothetical protein